MNALGEKIKELRKKKGLSQSELAELVGVTRQALSGWENGAYLPDYSSIVLLCKVLETDVNTLYGMQSPRASVDEKKTDNTQVRQYKPKKINPIFKIVLKSIAVALILFVGGVASMPFFDGPNSNKIYSVTIGLSDGDKMKIVAIVCLIVSVSLIVNVVKSIVVYVKSKKQGDILND